MIDKTKRAELRAKAAAATPGPWITQPIEDDGFEKGSCFIIGGNLAGVVGAALPHPVEIDEENWTRVQANAAHIAANDPQTTLVLLDALDAAEAEATKWQDLLDSNVSSMGRQLKELGDSTKVLEAENARLREALKPFAEVADSYDPDEGDSAYVAWGHDFTIGSLRHARAALEDKK